jgi:hypothetical protein
LAGAFLAAFLAGAFLAAFLAGAFLAAFLAGAFLAAFLAAAFLAGAFLAEAFFVTFLAVVFFFAMMESWEVEMFWTHLTYYRSSRSLLPVAVSSRLRGFGQVFFNYNLNLDPFALFRCRDHLD